MMFRIYVIPGLSLALVAWAVFSQHMGVGARRAMLAAAVLVACGVWALARTDGITGEGNAQLTWRWKKTAEQQLLAKPTVVEPVAPPKAIPPRPQRRSTGPDFADLIATASSRG
jgi:hypothetical protein